MKILITGGAGFIGSNLVEKLLMRNYKIVCIDNFDPFYSREIKIKNISTYISHPDFKLFECDIRNYNNLEKISDNIGCIIHLAAKAGVRESIKNPTEYTSVNILGTQNLLEFAKKRQIKKFIYASSSSVYGENPNIPWKETDNLLEPISPYAMTKISGELLTKIYSQLYGISVIALRFFTVYGPRQRPDLAISKFFRAIMNNHPIYIYGDGSSERDYTYIYDIVDGIIKSCELDFSNYEVFNLGNSHRIKLLDLINAIENVTGLKAKKVYSEKQLGDVPLTYADISKAKSILNYNPNTQLNIGLEEFYKWLKTTN